MPSDRLFGPSFATDAMRAAVSDQAWLRRMLDFEGALARVESRLGVIPKEAGEAIAARCHVRGFDLEQLGREARPAGNPVIPLVRALTAAVPGEAARHVHWGATSQDVLDTAMMLVARDGIDLLLTDVDRVAGACAALAAKHRTAVMAARTLLQQALPTTFGLKSAGWLVATLEARRALADYRAHRLAVELGGAAGTLAALGDRGVEVGAALAAELGLAEPVLPWHTDRTRVAELALTLGLVAGVMGKIAVDVALMSQTEVAEVAEPAGPGRGGSSTLPQKRNPVGSALVRACVAGVNAQAGLLLAAMSQEHERAVGAWQAEWPAVSEAFCFCSGAVAGMADVLEGLTVDEQRMRANLESTAGLVMSEAVMMALAEKTGRLQAHDLVEEAAQSAASSGRGLREALMADPRVTSELDSQAIDAALDPAAYLGSAEALIDRALAERQSQRSGRA